jgi:hypothetical protein
MSQFERIRYQSPDRRRQLLDSMIEVELLAQEARRRGLDQQPKTRGRIRQVLRDELLRRVREGLPQPADLPLGEVRAYYDKHRDDFKEPERRRVAHLEVATKAQAEKLLPSALDASAAEWGKLVKQHSLAKTPPGEVVPLELAGDMGIVSAPGVTQGANPNVPEPLRVAAFEISDLGKVHDEVVENAGRYHIVRLIGRTGARDRTFEEAERTIRIQLLQERARAAETKLEQQLRTRYPVVVDDAALAKVKLPKRDRKAADGRQ